MTSSTTETRLDALRRATTEKMVGGVASGIARSMNIDPVIVRIAFVVLTFVGFAGPLLYGAFWLLVPAEGAQRSPLAETFDLESDSQWRATGLILAGVLALAAVVGDSAWGMGGVVQTVFWITFWIVAPLAGLYWLFIVRPERSAAKSGGVDATIPPPPPYEPNAASSEPTVAFTESATVTVDGDAPQTGPVSSGPVPPDPVSPGVMPPAPRKRSTWSPALLLLTLSSVAVALGGLTLWSMLQEPLAPSVYPAAALAIVAIGLLIGMRFGYPGTLIPIGLLILPVLLLTSAVPNLTGGEILVRPTSAAAVAAPIEQGFGRVDVDLTAIADPTTLTGRTLEIDNGLGQVVVTVPRDLDVQVDAELSGGGRIDVFGTVEDGRNPSINQASDAPGAYRIEITGTAGEILVVRS